MYKPATYELYTRELKIYFARMLPSERIARNCTIENYTSRAVYMVPRFGYINIKLPFTVYFVINSGIEYDYPHTLGNIIILPLNVDNITEVVRHEMMHIYFHFYKSQALKLFCKNKNIIKITRDLMPGEITNPDTYYHTGLYAGGIIIFVALIHDVVTYKKAYYVWNGHKIRPARRKEILYYDLTLPYKQNYHPEEILANIYF